MIGALALLSAALVVACATKREKKEKEQREVEAEAEAMLRTGRRKSFCPELGRLHGAAHALRARRRCPKGPGILRCLWHEAPALPVSRGFPCQFRPFFRMKGSGKAPEPSLPLPAHAVPAAFRPLFSRGMPMRHGR